MKLNTPTQETRAAQRRSALSRRNFLRGVGACLALPAFESLTPLKLFAADATATGKLAVTASGAPLRSLFCFIPNGVIPDAWWPKEEGKDYAITDTLRPLEPNRALFQVMGGLDHRNAVGGPDGGGDHARGNGVFLTGLRLKKSATDVHAGTSIDQMIAQKVGHLTRLPSLELTCDSTRKSGGCDSDYACSYQFNISWSSPTTPLTSEYNPRLAFERVFGTGAPGERAKNIQRHQQEQQSVLDFVMEDAQRMEKRLSYHDKDKLDQYLTGVRELEQRIQKAERFGPSPDPAMATPSGVPIEHAEYVQVMFDILTLAFQTDSTRVASFCLAHDGDNRSFADIGIYEGHHDLSHHQNNPERINKVAGIDLWYAKQFAKFIQKLQDTKDVDGQSLLHNSMIVYGSGNSDGNRHTHNNLPILFAGAGGGTLNPGRYVKYPSVPTCNLFLSMADRMGLQGVERFGDSTGRLENI